MSHNPSRDFSRLIGACLTALVLLTAPAVAQEAPGTRDVSGAVQQPRASTGEITGAVTVLGCVPLAADLRVSGVRLAAEGERNVNSPARGNEPPLEARLARTTDPHTFSLTLPAIHVGQLYLLSIRALPPHPCGRLFWESPSRGLAYAGGLPVRFIGYSVRSKIEVLGHADGGRTREAWVGAENIDVSDIAGAIRQFRWHTDIPGVTTGVLQVATEQFPKQAETTGSCLAPPGLVHSATFSARTGIWVQAPSVNFAALVLEIAQGRGGAARVAGFHVGAPFYVRVVPVAGRTYRCDSQEDGPAPWTVLANGLKVAPKIPGPGFSVGGPSGPGPGGPDVKITWGTHYKPPVLYAHPKTYEVGVRVVKPHLMLKAFGYNDQNGTFHDAEDVWASWFVNGVVANTCPVKTPFDSLVPPCRGWFQLAHDDSGNLLETFLEGSVKLVTGIVDSLGYVVNAVAGAWESIKEAIVQVVAKAIEASGISDCDTGSLCEGLVKMALNTGLAAMGLPPSLPNWDELVDQGIEYAAYQVASLAGVGGIPGVQQLTEEAAKTIINKAVASMKDNRGGGPGLPDWLTLDLGEDPGMLTLAVDRLHDKGGLDTSRIHFPASPVYNGRLAPLPAKWPSGAVKEFGILNIPIVLRANISGFSAPTFDDGTPFSEYDTAKYARDFWLKKLEATSCHAFVLNAYAGNGFLDFIDKGPLGTLNVNPAQKRDFPPFLSCPVD